MKNQVTIRMGAAYNTVTVRASDGTPIVFNRRTMSKDENRNFHREFMNAFRGSGWEQGRSSATLNRGVRA
jgi:hypothetical protein